MATTHPDLHVDGTPRTTLRTSGARRAFVLLGVGLGAFVDGIVLHQILQWHHMLSSTGEHDEATLAGLEANTLADGLFHLFALACTVIGVLALRRVSLSGGRVGSFGNTTGWLLVGWGSFNVVEGLVNHHLLRLHHVRDDVIGRTPWDVAFLVVSVAMLVGGAWMARSSDTEGARREPT